MLSIFAVRAASIVLLDRDGSTATVRADRSVGDDSGGPGQRSTLLGLQVRLDDSPLLSELSRHPAPVVLTGADRDRAVDDLAQAMRDRGTGSLLLVPLLVRGEAIGALALDSAFAERPFSPGEIALAETVAGQIAGAIDNARLFDEMVEYVDQVRHVTDAAGALESGSFHLGSLDDVGRRPDALGQLARVFQQMARQVAAREHLLRQEVRQLRIEIDEVRAARRVEEITGSDHFHDLQQRGAQLRMDARPQRREAGER